jgi:hypothetical protein
VQVTRSVEARALAAGRRDRLTVTWLVDGVPGGDGLSGTITQGNPATYTAPAEVPTDGRVTIEARLTSNTSVSASDTLAVLFTVRHVDAEEGDDATGTGTWAAPLRTVTAGLAAAAPGDTVLVRPGAYGPAFGEFPPYAVPPDVTLSGVDRDSCALLGHGDEGVVVSLEDGSGVEHVTIGNADRDIVGIYTASTARIRWVLVTEPFLESAVRSAEGSEAVIEDCRLENARRQLSGRGIELISGSRAVVRRCTLRGWQEGAFVAGASDPLIEHCLFEANAVGVDTEESDLEHTTPDLGHGARLSDGGNVIRGNTLCGLANRTRATIFAINNTWNVPPVDPPVYCLSVSDSCDICVTNGGTVLWCECAPE